MASVLGDLWRIVDKQSYLGQEVLNVYYYRVTSVTGLTNDAYSQVADWFVDNIIDNVTNFQASQLVHNAVQIYNLSNGVDFFELPIVEPGANTVAESTLLPSYVTIGFKLVRESLVTRNGYKRFSGLFEGQVTGNTFNADPTQLAALEAALADDVTIGIATILEPIIVSSPIGSPPVAAYTYSSIGSAQITQLGTQNSRKAGHGT